MDHVINVMTPYYEVTLDCYIEEHKEGKYKKYSDNPYWHELQTLNSSMNILRKYLGWEPNNIVSEIRFRLES